ncbi:MULTISPECIES: flavin reductase family protein [unclassified Paenibacillus]|uniref:flavin reductase family protein n=1 Tax=unclassified Paenibacillus TaxID=185978 RepID=UPI001AE8AE1F|nr:MULTISPECIES: flavin reductase family protein [unclassified Paenibacillus]MBP1157223.1 flavin reductase (DIM6/NTAB) family NADH-FMN oxidoreductase RutF [Paenibacillus sp. PvP091]MBP1172038.1 flavin reductase (DIM6/NTAB) family NADH-FMN oxidoreductase RutF [Paenibacillus sp. PvR098]MBP2438419.1 flavin reductase (DIM6/NTAB) family NADH-FMN oxidoreductase RutF [Paenibacillus sp. PvP052]
MISIDPASQSDKDNYKLLIGSIIPRPVALTTTLSKEGVLNAAPFSYFNIVTSSPPMVSVSVQRNKGLLKDTARNAQDTGAFVVHISDETYVEEMNQTSASLGPEESEVQYAGLTPIPSEKVAVPGVAEAKIRMECVLERSIPLGGTETAPACDLLIGRVVCFHIAEEIFQNGHIDPEGLKPVSRLGGRDYGKLGDIFSIERPV